MSNHNWIGPPRYIPEDGETPYNWEVLIDEFIDSGLTPDEIRRRLQPISAVLTFHLEGTKQPCGQVVGADGRGDYAYVIYGGVECAERWAINKVQSVMQSANRITSVTLVTDCISYYKSNLELVYLEDEDK